MPLIWFSSGRWFAVLIRPGLKGTLYLAFVRHWEAEAKRAGFHFHNQNQFLCKCCEGNVVRRGQRVCTVPSDHSRCFTRPRHNHYIRTQWWNKNNTEHWWWDVPPADNFICMFEQKTNLTKAEKLLAGEKKKQKRFISRKPWRLRKQISSSNLLGFFSPAAFIHWERMAPVFLEDF